MNTASLSNIFTVRRLNGNDIDLIYNLCADNKIFYQYHPPFVTRESILQDMEALPPGRELSDKFYVGFFDGNALIAVLDLIIGYPDKNTDFIGFFMMDASRCLLLTSKAETTLTIWKSKVKSYLPFPK